MESPLNAHIDGGDDALVSGGNLDAMESPRSTGSFDPSDMDTIRMSMYEDDDHDNVMDVIREDSYVVDDAGRRSVKVITDQPAASEKLGTIQGVFLPTVQNILGVILFLRLPYITAQAGTILTSVIVTLCVISTFLTSLSLSAVATNGKIREGGPYYIVSRNLGLEMGGAVGLLFYLGTAIAGSMYVLGGVEAIQVSFLMDEDEDSYTEAFTFETQIEALILCALMISVVYGGVALVNKSAFVFLAIVLISIMLLILGVILFAADVEDGELTDEDRVFGDNLGPAFEEDPDTGLTPDFFSLIALFYPSVTGIMAGSNRSGVLTNPGKAIPSGTISAIITTYGIYLLTVWMFGLFISNEALKADKLIVAAVAWPVKYCVQVGIVLSCVGAGLQSFTGAPRLLVAIANDGYVPFLQRFAQKKGEDIDVTVKRAVILTWIIASLPCLAGNLDFITPFITMLFLLMYATVNLSCYILAVMRAPGWRPSFKYFHWSTALFGAVWCLGLMMIISWYTAIIVLFIALCLLVYINSQEAQRDWGDSLRGLRLNIVRDNLLQLDTRAEFHAKNWRPQLLLVTDIDEHGNPTRPDMLLFAGQLKKGRGLLMVNAFLDGDIKSDIDKAKKANEVLRLHLSEEGIKGFARVIMTNDPATAIFAAVQSAGVGTLQPNCVMFGYPDNLKAAPRDEQDCFVDMIKSSIATRKTTILMKGGVNVPEPDQPIPSGTIDIWWVVYDGGVLMLFPYLLTLHKAWANCRLRLFAVVTDEDASASEVQQRTKAFLEKVRIPAEVIPVAIGDINAGYAYGKTVAPGRGSDLARVAAKSELLDTLELPNTMTVAVRGAREEPKPQGAGALQALFNQEEGGYQDVGTPTKKSEAGAKVRFAEEVKVTEIKDTDTFESRVRSTSTSFKMDKKRSKMAVFMNTQMKTYSGDAKLIVTNLPLRRSDPTPDFVGFVESLTDGLETVVMIRGSGSEVVTVYG
mmetsp:Transcript_11824/g.35882  ORF Transcript_11824/g.35882 Transcript_11824/m.35882 type:complete len:973 (-) Transcript_11824:76-2994(-)